MAKQPPRLSVTITPKAQRDINSIWEWNATDKNPARVQAYEDFLLGEINKLGVDYPKGRLVPNRPDYRYVIAKKSVRGHGHYVIYQVESGSVEILHLLHTRQDLHGKAERGDL
jgi:plasmid stabilization system protein ParE